LLLPISTVFCFRTYREIRKIIKEHGIDIVHVHNTLNLISPSAYYAALSFKIPIVQTIHNFRLLCPGATFYRNGQICEDCVEHGLLCAARHSCYRNSKLQTLACVINTKIHRFLRIYEKLNYICLTDFNKEKLLQLKQIRPERVFVKPNFVQSISHVIPYEQREKQFVFAGRIDKLKGIDILLKAWKLMETNAPKIVICGTGPMEDWCKNYISDNDLKSVEMKGFVPNTQVRAIIANSQVLLLPTQWYEGFPMSIVEAFSAGTPVITTDLGNAGILVEEGVTGSKFVADSPEELVKAVQRIDGYKSISDSTLSAFKIKYTEARNYEYLMKIYDAVKH